VMGPSQKVLTLVGSHQFFVAQGRVSLSWFGFEFGKFPLKMLNFLGQKIFSGQDKKYTGQRQVDLLFTAGQK